MAPAYQNVSSGQVVVSDEPRPDLERLARWVEVPVPEEPQAPEVPVPSEDWTHEQIDAHANEHGIELPSSAKTKADKVAVIVAATAQKGE